MGGAAGAALFSSLGGAGGAAADSIHADSCALRDFDLLQDSGGGSRDFSVNLVGRDLEQGLVTLNLVAGLLQPFGYSAFDNGFTHLGHDDVSWHDFLP